MQTETLPVTGMTCGGCADALSRALREVPGVRAVSVSLQRKDATVQFDDALASADKLRAAIRAAGYGTPDAQAVPPRQRTGCCCG